MVWLGLAWFWIGLVWCGLVWVCIPSRRHLPAGRSKPVVPPSRPPVSPPEKKRSSSPWTPGTKTKRNVSIGANRHQRLQKPLHFRERQPQPTVIPLDKQCALLTVIQRASRFPSIETHALICDETQITLTTVSTATHRCLRNGANMV